MVRRHVSKELVTQFQRQRCDTFNLALRHRFIVVTTCPPAVKPPAVPEAFLSATLTRPTSLGYDIASEDEARPSAVDLATSTVANPPMVSLACTAQSRDRVTAHKTKEDSNRHRGFADALVWIIVLIILTPLVIAAVLALYQRFF